MRTLFPLCLLLAACGTPRPLEERDQLKLNTLCEKTIQLFQQKDAGLKKWFTETSYGYAVFPEVTKAGVAVGGAWGRGQVYEKGERIGYATLSQGTVGLQLGIQSYAEVIFFRDETALKDFQRGNFEVSAQVSAIAATAGASADADYSGGVAIFTLGIGGVMFEATVGGQKFEYDAN